MGQRARSRPRSERGDPPASRGGVPSLGPPDSPTSYSELIRLLALRLPSLANLLASGEASRAGQLRALLGGARLRGLEELHVHLHRLEDQFARRHPIVAGLIRRSRADFEAALEATLSGYTSEVADAMRDVSEVELLLLDFSLDPARIMEWRTLSRRDRLRQFRPAVIRERLRAAGIGRFAGNAGEDTDYRAHSEALHVSPFTPVIARREPRGSGRDDPWDADAGFWEMFEHARRLIIATDALRASLKIRPLRAVAPSLRHLKDFRDAWDRTQEMQAIYIALLMATLEGEGH